MNPDCPICKGIGWSVNRPKPGVVGEVTVKAVEGSSEGHALQTGHPVCSSEIEHETRFEYADFIKENGVKALVNVAIGGSTHLNRSTSRASW